MDIKILVAGDFCPKYRVSQAVDNGNFDIVLGNIISYTSRNDINIVNFETTVADEKCCPIAKRGPNLSCNDKAVDALKYAGFNVVTLANNHFYDFGDRGVMLSIEAFRNRKIEYVGGGNYKEVNDILYKKIKGKTIAICNFCENEFSVAEGTHSGCNGLNPIRNYYSILEARKRSDFLLVITHGGHEFLQYPSLRMKQLFHWFVDIGADAVVNHHQHCFSGYEVYRGKPIFYGLGNFSFDWENHTDENWLSGFFVELTIDDNNESQFCIVPYWQSKGNDIGVRIKDGKDKDKFFEQIGSINQIISNDVLLESTCNSFFGKNELQYIHTLEPYSNKCLWALYIRHLLPSFLSKKRLLDLLLYLRCESHRERIIKIVEKKI